MDILSVSSIVNLTLTILLCVERFIRNVHPHFRYHRKEDTYSFGMGSTPRDTPSNTPDSSFELRHP